MKPEELELLKKYFPEKAVPLVGNTFNERHFQLCFERPRTTKLGDFRPPRTRNSKVCRITLNCDLNPYQMLVTFVHEVAHYEVFDKYGMKNLQPHGEEWKAAFNRLLQPYLTNEIFPDDVLQQLREHLLHITASSNADQDLQRVLQNYDERPASVTTVEQLAEGTRFVLRNGKTFQKGPKQRTRHKCLCEDNGQWYTVAGLAEVVIVLD